MPSLMATMLRWRTHSAWTNSVNKLKKGLSMPRVRIQYLHPASCILFDIYNEKSFAFFTFFYKHYKGETHLILFLVFYIEFEFIQPFGF
jgi:hypothetical protein